MTDDAVDYCKDCSCYCDDAFEDPGVGECRKYAPEWGNSDEDGWAQWPSVQGEQLACGEFE